MSKPNCIFNLINQKQAEIDSGLRAHQIQAAERPQKVKAVRYSYRWGTFGRLYKYSPHPPHTQELVFIRHPPLDLHNIPYKAVATVGFTLGKHTHARAMRSQAVSMTTGLQLHGNSWQPFVLREQEIRKVARGWWTIRKANLDRFSERYRVLSENGAEGGKKEQLERIKIGGAAIVVSGRGGGGGGWGVCVQGGESTGPALAERLDQ